MTPEESDFNKYDKFIVVDEDGRAMSFSDGQFCYCTTEYWQDKQFPVRVYGKKRAKELMSKSLAFRRENRFPIVRYELMPIKIPKT